MHGRLSVVKRRPHRESAVFVWPDGEAVHDGLRRAALSASYVRPKEHTDVDPSIVLAKDKEATLCPFNGPGLSEFIQLETARTRITAAGSAEQLSESDLNLLAAGVTPRELHGAGPVVRCDFKAQSRFDQIMRPCA